ncbi:PD-(D/E)XK nuclease family protein [Nitrosopumilus sp.]|uniref:PD-(D/E)XK nuclease family protein n=1 Tax=Nitrosopumilus sp. TaxID=2024843 RepID=UPI003D0AFB5E
MFSRNFHDAIDRPFAKEDYDETGHYYLTDKGKRYPSITTIFKLIDPFEKTDGYEAFVTWAMNKNNIGRTEAIEWCKKYSKSSTDVGTALHKYAEDYLTTGELPQKVRPSGLEKEPYELFEVLKKWLDENLSEVNGTEFKLYSDELGLAGTVDVVAKLNDGTKVIIDFKNSRKPKTPKKCEDNHYFEQMCAYAKMWEFCTGEKIEYGIILVVSWDGKVRPFKVKLSDYESKLWNWAIKYEMLDV